MLKARVAISSALLVPSRETPLKLPSEGFSSAILPRTYCADSATERSGDIFIRKFFDVSQDHRCPKSRRQGSEQFHKCRLSLQIKDSNLRRRVIVREAIQRNHVRRTPLQPRPPGFTAIPACVKDNPIEPGAADRGR